MISAGPQTQTCNDTGGTDMGSLPVRIQSARWRRIATSNVFLGLILALLVWPFSTNSLFVPKGLGSSWVFTLAWAAHNGTPFGTHIIFTYGPLGFLQTEELIYRGTTVLSVAFALTFFAAILGTLVWSLRRSVHLIVAVAVGYVFGIVTFRYGVQSEDMLALVLVVCVAALSRTDADRVPGWIWIVLGGVLSVFTLIKVSIGVGIAAALIVTVAFLPGRRWRVVGFLLVGAIPTFWLCWFGTGNGFGNFIAFAKGSAAIISGYAPAMSLEVPNRLYTYALVPLVVVVVGGLVLAHTDRLPRKSTVGIGLVTVVILWVLFKEGFVRHDTHDLIFFGAAPLVLVAFAPKRWSWAPVMGVLVLTGVYLVAAIGSLPAAPRPDLAVRNFFDEATTLASPGRTASVIDQSRRSLQDTYALPNQMVALMRGQTVDVSPWEQAVVWAYPQIHFDPLPVIQDYSAYTPSLDQLDTSYLTSPDAPRFILRQPWLAIDGRNAAWEPPAAQLAIMCHYRQASGDAQWQLLEQGVNRCGPLRPLGTVTTGFRHWVVVPTAPAGDAIVARFQLSLGSLSSLESVIFKPPNVFMDYNKSYQDWRFVAPTAPDPHILVAASTLGYSRDFVPVSLSSLRFLIAGRNRTSSGVKVSFYRVQVAPVAAGTGEILLKLATSLLFPRNGSTVSGTAVIDADATSHFKLIKVQFYVTGASQHATLIGTGAQSLDGWIAQWNTTNVANGTYMLQSVAYDAAGQSSASKGITITVQN